MLTTLWIVFALSYATHAARPVAGAGAFIGGMLISETISRHQVEPTCGLPRHPAGPVLRDPSA